MTSTYVTISAPAFAALLLAVLALVYSNFHWRKTCKLWEKACADWEALCKKTVKLLDQEVQVNGRITKDNAALQTMLEYAQNGRRSRVEVSYGVDPDTGEMVRLARSTPVQEPPGTPSPESSPPALEPDSAPWHQVADPPAPDPDLLDASEKVESAFRNIDRERSAHEEDRPHGKS